MEGGLVGAGGIINGAPDPKTVERFKKYNQNTDWIVIKEGVDRKGLINEFIKSTYQCLGLDKLPQIILTQNKEKTQTYAHNDIANDIIVVYIANRSLGDILRSLGHELIHYAQKEDGSMDDHEDPGATGSDIENEANAGAGILLRNFGKAYPQIFE